MIRKAAALALIGVGLACAPAQAQVAEDPVTSEAPGLVIADIRLNGADTGLVGEFTQGADGGLSGAAEVLSEAGLAVPPGDGLADLKALPGVSYVLRQDTQTLEITAEPRALQHHALAGPARAAAIPDRASPGALLNYSVNLTGGGGTFDAAAFGEARLFAGPGVFSSTFVAHGGDRASARRLETALRINDPLRSRRLILGDFVGSGLSWTRPVRAAGISLASDFAMRPDIVTQPLANIAGTAAAQSTVELFIDGVRRFSVSAPAGPFTIDQPPVVNGRGDVSLVVTDVTGRQTVQTFAFYASEDLLRPGLDAYAVDAGFVRLGYSGEDDRYADPFVSASFRRGLNDSLTVQGHAEFADGLQQLGVGAVTTLAGQALASGALSLSSSRDGTGAQLHLGVRRDAAAFNLFASLDQSFGSYADIASLEGDAPVRRRVQAGASAATRAGAFGLNYSLLKAGQADRGVLTATWSRALSERASLYVTGYSTSGAQGGGLTVGLSVPLGAQRAAGLSATLGESRNLQAYATQSPTEGGGVGWRAEERMASDRSVQGEVYVVDDAGEHAIGASYAGDAFAGRAYSTGSVVFMGGRPRLARQVSGSLILVDTGLPDLGVRFQNREVGVTGADGRLLIAQALPYVPGEVELIPETVPIDIDILTPERQVTPPGGAGVIVSLPVRPTRAVSLSITAADGRELPVGSPVLLNGQPAGVLGYGGMVYLSGLLATNRIEVVGTAGSCVADYDLSAPSRELACQVAP